VSTVVSAPAAVVVDTTAPVIVLNPSTGTNAPITGTVTDVGGAVGTVQVTTTDTTTGVATTATVVVDPVTGTFTTPAPAVTGTYTVTVAATDTANNVSTVVSAPAAVVVDTTAPASPVFGVVGGNITGTAEVGCNITVYINGVAQQSAATDNLGNFSVAAPTAPGTYTITATAADVAGNTSAAATLTDATGAPVNLVVVDPTTAGGAPSGTDIGVEGQTLYATGEEHELEGGEGNDTLYGRVGTEELDGEEGNDTLHGSHGNEELEGGEGNDTLYGGKGNDLLEGGDGSDVFAWSLADRGTDKHAAVDTIADFNKTRDSIDLRNLLDGGVGDKDGHEGGDDAVDNLLNYIRVGKDGGDTVLHISSEGKFGNGESYSANKEDQTIVIKDVDLTVQRDERHGDHGHGHEPNVDQTATLLSMLKNGNLNVNMD